MFERRSFVAPLVLLVVLLCVIVGWRMFAAEEIARYKKVHAFGTLHSFVELRMHVIHEQGPVIEEEYVLRDFDGFSSAVYRAHNRRGLTITVKAPPARLYDVSFFFDRTRQDGIWELTNRPLRGETATRYTVAVRQTVGGKSGSREFTFTDPHYWAVTAGREYHLHLDRNKPVPDLLKLASTTVSEPRYERLVRDFRTFQTDHYLEKVSDARKRLAARP